MIRKHLNRRILVYDASVAAELVKCHRSTKKVPYEAVVREQVKTGQGSIRYGAADSKKI